MTRAETWTEYAVCWPDLCPTGVRTGLNNLDEAHRVGQGRGTDRYTVHSRVWTAGPWQPINLPNHQPATTSSSQGE